MRQCQKEKKMSFRPKSFYTVSRRNFLRLAGTTAGGALLAACGVPQAGQAPAPAAATLAPQAGPAAGEPRYGGTVRFGLTREAAGAFDPALVVASTVLFNHWVYEPLLDIDEDYANPIPRLATSWESSENGAVWTFNLRQGVMFHHGRPLSADDVIHTFTRVLDPDFGSTGRLVFESIQDMDAPDDLTVRFRLDSPNADFPILHTVWQGKIVPHDLSNQEIESEPRGTGPFRIDNYAHADRISFYRNEEYWEEGRPYLDSVEFVSIPEATTMANALRAGEVDIFFQLSTQMVQLLQDDPNIAIAPTEPLDIHEIFMNLEAEPFNDDRVRRAIKLIGDRVAMTEIAWPNSNARPDDDNPVIPTSPFRIDTNMWEQDLEEARRLLDEAGHGDGLELTLWTINDEPGILDFSLAFADWARQAGVTINIEAVPSDTYYANNWLEVPFGTVSWVPRTTVDEQLRLAFHSEAPWNETRYRNPQFDQMLDEARGETDTARRAELYAELQSMLVEEGGQIIPYHYPRMAALRAQVQNFRPHPLNGMDPRNVWLAEA
jgi:peptide/nickel transport system substrate-binding protein